MKRRKKVYVSKDGQFRGTAAEVAAHDGASVAAVYSRYQRARLAAGLESEVRRDYVAKDGRIGSLSEVAEWNGISRQAVYERHHQPKAKRPRGRPPKKYSAIGLTKSLDDWLEYLQEHGTLPRANLPMVRSRLRIWQERSLETPEMRRLMFLHGIEEARRRI